MTRYDKLVRDRIPEIIESNGETCEIRPLSDDEWLPMLRAKLAEECAEYLEAGSVGELADMLEVMRAIVARTGLIWDDLEAIRIAKREERGGFDDGVFLIRKSRVSAPDQLHP